MNSRERILAALALKQPDRVPFADIVDETVKVKLMGRQNFTEAEFAQLLGLDAIGMEDYAAPVFCNTLELEGREYIIDGLIQKEQDLDLICFPNLSRESFYDPVKRFVEQYGKDELAIYVKCRWGISGVLYSMGLVGLTYALYNNPRLVERLLDRYVEWNCQLVERLNTIGIDFIMNYDNIACNHGPLVVPKVFKELFVPKIKLVAEKCRLPWVYHSDGNLMPVMEDILSLGMDGLHPLDPGGMDIKKMKEAYGDKVCLWGNIDLRHTLTKGSREEVEAEVKQRIKEVGPKGGFILGSANSLPDYCKVENIWAMAKSVKKYGSYD